MTVDVDQRRGTRILFLAMALSVSLSCLAQTPEPFEVRRAQAAFEELPVLNARESVKNIGKKSEPHAAEGSKMQQMIGFSDAKRKVAAKLGVDPYSTNSVLQRELEGIAWASFAGGLTFQVATMPIGGPALTVTGVTSTFDEMLKEKSPTDLKIVNRKTLLALGANGKETERFLNNNAFSPSEQTAFVLNLKSLDSVTNRGAFVRAAGETSSDEQDAIFCVQTAALMAQIHKNDKQP